MDVELFDHGSEMIWRAHDRYAADAATAQLWLVVENGNDLALRRRVGLQHFDVERGEARRADHNDVLDSGMLTWLGLPVVSIAQRQDGARDEHSGGQNESLDDGDRARDALKPGKDEEHAACG